MKKTQKIVALACAGIVAASIAALPISAATVNSGTTDVKYIAGTVPTDPDNNGNRLVALPASVTFATGSDPTVNDFNISLISKDGTNFPDSVNVEVKAFTNNGLKLKSTSVAGIEGNYTASWGGKSLTSAAVDAASAVEVVTFSKANFDTIISENTHTQTGTLTLPQAEMDKLEQSKPGAVFEDIITFNITDNTDNTNP